MPSRLSCCCTAVASVRFILGKEQLEDVKVSGKSKRGSVIVGEGSTVLEATTADGSVYPVFW